MGESPTTLDLINNIIKDIKENNIDVCDKINLGLLENYYSYKDLDLLYTGISKIDTTLADYFRGEIFRARCENSFQEEENLDRTSKISDTLVENINQATYWLCKSSNAGFLQSTITLYYIYRALCERSHPKAPGVENLDKCICRLFETPESTEEMFKKHIGYSIANTTADSVWFIRRLVSLMQQFQRQVVDKQQYINEQQTTINELKDEITRLLYIPGAEGYQEVKEHFDDLAAQNSKQMYLSAFCDTNLGDEWIRRGSFDHGCKSDWTIGPKPTDNSLWSIPYKKTRYAYVFMSWGNVTESTFYSKFCEIFSSESLCIPVPEVLVFQTDILLPGWNNAQELWDGLYADDLDGNLTIIDTYDYTMKPWVSVYDLQKERLAELEKERADASIRDNGTEDLF